MTWVYLNGAYIPAGEARVAADDAGLLYGRGLFETFRARRGAVYRLERHLDRLRTGARLLDIALPPTLAELPEIVRQLSQRCGLEDARMRLTLSAGPSTGLRTGPESGGPSLLIQARPPTEYPEALYERGMSAVVVSVRRNESSPLSHMKSLNYLDNLLTREEARRHGAHEALLLNTQGKLAEGSASNLFVIQRGELLTPPVEDGALPGIARSAVLDLAREAEISAQEESLILDDLHGADEAFLTGAIMGVMPLVSVDSAKVGSGRPGPVTLRLRALYEAAATP